MNDQHLEVGDIAEPIECKNSGISTDLICLASSSFAVGA